MRRIRILTLLALFSLIPLGAACNSGSADETTTESTSEQQATEQPATDPGAEVVQHQPGEHVAQHQPGEHMGSAMGGQHMMGGEHMMGSGMAGEHMGSGMPGHVEVSAEGTQFDPPVQPEQIPDGAWYCDMGTVHYAAMEPGDGTCPLCGMRLHQKGAEE